MNDNLIMKLIHINNFFIYIITLFNQYLFSILIILFVILNIKRNHFSIRVKILIIKILILLLFCFNIIYYYLFIFLL